MSSICVFKFSALMLNTTLYEKTYNFFKFFFSVFWTPFTHKKIFLHFWDKNKIACLKVKLNWTRGLFFVFHPKVKVKERISSSLTTLLNWSSFWNSEQSESRNPKFPPLKSCLVVVGWRWGGLFDYRFKPGPDLSRYRLC